MLIFGHRFVPSEPFYHITNVEDVLRTPPSSTIYFSFDEDNLDIVAHANANFVNMALSVKDVTQLMFASALNAKYIIVEREICATAQEIAQNYLFDAKILVTIQDDEEIEEMASLGVDGVVYPNAIIKITS
jgi:hypothetical protein